MVVPPGTPSLKAKATRRRKQPMAKTDTILVVNAGSSSIKFSLYPAAPGDSAILGGGIVEGIGVAPQFKGRICGRISEERWPDGRALDHDHFFRSEEHTSELQSLMRISYAVFCLKKNTTNITTRKSCSLTDLTKTT